MSKTNEKGDLRFLPCGTCRYGDGSAIGSRPGMILGVRKGCADTYDIPCPTCKLRGEVLVWVGK